MRRTHENQRSPLLDHFPYTYAQGIVITGLWLGSLDYLARRRATRALSG